MDLPWARALGYLQAGAVDCIDGGGGFLGYESVRSAAGMHPVETKIRTKRFARGNIREEGDLALRAQRSQADVGIQVSPSQAAGLLLNKAVVLPDGLVDYGGFLR